MVPWQFCSARGLNLGDEALKHHDLEKNFPEKLSADFKKNTRK